MGKIFELSNQQKIEIIETRYLSRTELENYKSLIENYRFVHKDFSSNSIYTYNHFFSLYFHTSSGNSMTFSPAIIFNAEPKIEACNRICIKDLSFFVLDDNLAIYTDNTNWISNENIAQIYDKSVLKSFLKLWTDYLFDDNDKMPTKDELTTEYLKMLVESEKRGIEFSDFREFEQGSTPYIEIDDYKTLVKYIPAEGEVDIVIPEGIEAIRNEAFSLNREKKAIIRSIHLPRSLKFIEDGTFWDLYDLESITVSPGNSAFQNIDGVLYGKGWECVDWWIQKDESNSIPEALICYPPAKKDIKEFILPEGIKTITCGAFSNCQLEAITINAKKDGKAFRIYIYDYAFRNCTKLSTLNLGNTKDIQFKGFHHFDNCNIGLQVNYGKKITFLTTVGLLSKNKKTIYYSIPDSNQEWHIPEGTEKSVDHFTNWNTEKCGIKKIFFPKSFLDISNYAFNGIESVEEIYLGENTKVIGRNGFLNCRNLKRLEAANAEALDEYSLNACINLETIVLGPNCEFDTFGWPDTVVVEAPKGSQTIENAKKKGVIYKEI